MNLLADSSGITSTVDKKKEDKIQSLMMSGLTRKQAEMQAEGSVATGLLGDVVLPKEDKTKTIISSGLTREQAETQAEGSLPSSGLLEGVKTPEPIEEPTLLEYQKEATKEATGGVTPTKEAPKEASKESLSYSQTRIPEEEYTTKYKPYMDDLEAESVKLAPQFAKELQDAQNIYAVSKDNIANKEMWDSIIKGLGHLAAGIVGLQTGLDLGGVKFDKKDWESERNMIANELQTAKQHAKEKMSAQQQDIADKRSKLMENWKIEDSMKERALGIRKFNEENKMALDKERRQYETRAAERKEDLETAVTAEPKLTPEQQSIKSDMTRINQNFDSAMDKFRTGDDSDANISEIVSSAKQVNSLAAQLGIAPKYPEELFVKDNAWFSNPNKYEDIKKRIVDFTVQASKQTTEKKVPAGYKLITLKSGEQLLQSITNPKDVRKIK